MVARYVEPKITGACHSQTLIVTEVEDWFAAEAKGRVLFFARKKHQQITE